MKESASVDIGKDNNNMLKLSQIKGVPLDSGLATPGNEIPIDPFEQFNSVTLHHDGDEP